MQCHIFKELEQTKTEEVTYRDFSVFTIQVVFTVVFFKCSCLHIKQTPHLNQQEAVKMIDWPERERLHRIVLTLWCKKENSTTNHIAWSFCHFF